MSSYSKQEQESKKPADAKRCLLVSSGESTTTIAFMGMLDENSLSLTLQFAAENSEILVSLRKVNKRFLQVVDSALFWREQGDGGNKSIPRGIVQDALTANGHGHLVWDSDFGLESFGFYEQIVAAGLFEKKPMVRDDSNYGIPMSVSRILNLYRVLKSFPRIKADWKQKGVIHKNVVASIVTYMVDDGILPDPNKPNRDRHIQIHNNNSKKTFALIYHNYRAKVPRSLFQPSTPPEVFQETWTSIPLHLKLLVALGNLGLRW